MAKLSIKLNILPGITRDINLTLEDLLEAFNSSWNVNDKMKLIAGLDLNGTTKEKVVALVNILNTMDLDSLTIGELMALDNTINNFKTKIDIKKQEIIKNKE